MNGQKTRLVLQLENDPICGGLSPEIILK